MALLVQTSSAPSRSACWTASCRSGRNRAEERQKVLVREVWNVDMRGRTVFDKVVQSGVDVFCPGIGDGRKPAEDGR